MFGTIKMVSLFVIFYNLLTTNIFSGVAIILVKKKNSLSEKDFFFPYC